MTVKNAVPALGSPAIITLAAVPGAIHHVATIGFSCIPLPAAGGQLTVTDNVTVVYNLDIGISSGEFNVDIDSQSDNTGMEIRLSGGLNSQTKLVVETWDTL